MYTSYWGMQARPFENTFDPAFYYPAPSHQSTLLRLRYALEDRAGCAILAGQGGMGKTLLLRHFQRSESIRETLGPFVHLVFPQLNPEELLTFCAASLCAELESRGQRIENRGQEATVCQNQFGQGEEIFNAGSEALLILEMERLLKRNVRSGKRCVLIVDEADLIDDPKTFRLFKSLLDLECDGRPCLSILFMGEGSLFSSIASIESLEQRIEAKCFLSPFSDRETDRYIAHRLMVSGCQKEVFRADAARLIHDLTQGVPRQINRLCDLSLLIGFAEKMNTIRREAIETLYNELVSI